MENTSKQKAQTLKNIIKNGNLCLPVFVRFQTKEKYHTLPVNGIEFDDRKIKVISDSAILTLDWNELDDIVAFRDSAHSAVFLN